MIKAIKKKLSGKVFLITFVLLVSACSGTFFCILKIMPSSYLDTLNRNAEAQSLELLDTLSTYDNLDKCIKAISDFEIQTGSTVWLDDEYGNTLYPSHSMLELQEANAQLKTDIEKERELERQRMDFFGAASHELKTPLTVLKGHLSGMLNGVVGYENHSKYLQRSLAVTEKMEVLIRELLYISRIEKNKTSIQFANIDFAELLRTVIAELTDFISEKKLSLHINIPDRVSCPLDRAEMERAIQNILINAIRYSPDGEQVIVTVTETNTIISCSIENTGVKIPETTICHLFEPFYRVDISRNSATGGTGLGLYIVRGILENHNAEYGIKNTENGVCFWLRLPKKQ